MSERTTDHELAEMIADMLPNSAAADALKVFEQCVNEGKNPSIVLEGQQWTVVHDIEREGS